MGMGAWLGMGMGMGIADYVDSLGTVLLNPAKKWFWQESCQNLTKPAKTCQNL